MTEVIVPPNSISLIRALELYLEQAKKGQMSWLALVAYRRGPFSHAGWEPKNDDIKCFYGGDVSINEPGREAVRCLGEMIEEQILCAKPPERDEDLDASYVCFNMVKGGVSFDFIPWMIDAEMTRIRLGGAYPLKVGFWFGRDGKLGMQPPGRQMWLDNVLRPALTLIGAVEDPRAVDGRYKHFYTTRDIVVAHQNGEPVPILHAPWSEKDKIGGRGGYVTITLRESDQWPHRNSNLDAWPRFASYLEMSGEDVIFVRDTAKSNEPMESFNDCPEASTNLLFRAALYESAKCNLFISNGPYILQVFGERPWLCFIPKGNDTDIYKPNTPSFWRNLNGVEVGEQYPWSRPDQRIIWKPDTYENLVEAWEKYFALDEIKVSA